MGLNFSGLSFNPNFNRGGGNREVGGAEVGCLARARACIGDSVTAVRNYWQNSGVQSPRTRVSWFDWGLLQKLKTLSRFIFGIPTWVFSIVCLVLLAFGSYSFISNTQDGLKLSCYTLTGFKGIDCELNLKFTILTAFLFWLACILLCALIGLLHFMVGKILIRNENVGNWVSVGIKAILVALFPMGSTCLQNVMQPEPSAFVPLLIITWSVYVALALFGWQEDFSLVDCFGSFNLAVAFIMYPQHPLSLLVSCLSTTFKVVLPEVIEAWRNWADIPDPVYSANPLNQPFIKNPSQHSTEAHFNNEAEVSS
ncbi:OLC1v1016750C1 [Oldenlandia corymbosa var. corymbosa]|uniref:OLC1v1016750C1 n=1 Tax=Oldenlandia corymbosa var. corymbosa TaxID=529605 RepID=A0AAV1E7V7_OLDCO|nr:OLC1v1016750C1 [Oldenlandia corymbosa var. corymbosa]